MLIFYSPDFPVGGIFRLIQTTLSSNIQLPAASGFKDTEHFKPPQGICNANKPILSVRNRERLRLRLSSALATVFYCHGFFILWVEYAAKRIGITNGRNSSRHSINSSGMLNRSH
jgi:hypothetical protein